MILHDFSTKKERKKHLKKSQMEVTIWDKRDHSLTPSFPDI